MTIDFQSLSTRTETQTAHGRRADPAARHDFKSLVLALQSGDIDGARKALEAVRQDLAAPAAAAEATPHATTSDRTTALGIGDALDVLDQALFARERGGETAASAATSQTSEIDYGRFASMTPYQVYMANPNGLPAGWDWSQWSQAAGAADPSHTDVAGNALGADGFVAGASSPAPEFDRAGAAFDWNRTGAFLAREGSDGSAHTMTIDPPANWSGGIELYGGQAPSSLGELSGVSYVVKDAQGNVVATTNGAANAAGNGVRFAASGAQGPYTVTVTFSGAGKETFNCLHQP